MMDAKVDDMRGSSTPVTVHRGEAAASDDVAAVANALGRSSTIRSAGTPAMSSATTCATANAVVDARRSDWVTVADS